MLTPKNRTKVRFFGWRGLAGVVDDGNSGMWSSGGAGGMWACEVWWCWDF